MDIVQVAILIITFGLLLFLIFSALLNISHYKLASINKPTHLDDLPTVSLCIPARNENHALTDCLTRAIASDYPKLEILVLDDCSQDHTSHIIRGFSHDGVRFVQGSTPSDGWLGKNNAYSILAHEARGDIYVFLSVDTHITPTTITQIVTHMRSNRMQMISVLPWRSDSHILSIVFSSLRYFWQVILPSSLNTPFSSSLWSIDSDALDRYGGFEEVKDSIHPEHFFAKKTFEKNTYQFLVANQLLDVVYAKKWSSQKDTAIRLWYPLLQKKVLLAIGAVFFHVILFIIPSLLLIFNIYYQYYFVAALALCVVIANVFLAYLYTRCLSPHLLTCALAVVFFPITVIQECMYIILSFIAYKRGKVDWKGRNVCFPRSPQSSFTK